MVDAPHFAVPLRIGGSGRFAVVEQDSDDDLVSCVAACLATPQGSRAEVPEYGSPRFEFTLPAAPDVAAAVEQWEPRVTLDLEMLEGVSGVESMIAITALVRPAISDGGD